MLSAAMILAYAHPFCMSVQRFALSRGAQSSAGAAGCMRVRRFVGAGGGPEALRCQLP